MEYIPSIDSFFDLEKAFREYGFKIADRDDHCIAYGYQYEGYGEITIEFYQRFFSFSIFPTDMHVVYYETVNHIPEQRTLFLGVAPTNQHDFDMLMQLLFPSEAFVGRIERKMMDQEILASLG